MIQLNRGNALDLLRTLSDESVDSIVTDPPYGLSTDPDPVEVLTHWINGDDYTHQGGGFMGKAWDSFVPGPSVWKECLRVLKPGGHLLCFAGSRTVDLMGMAIRLGGFEIRDQLQWLYGSGFPKSMDVAKAIDKAARGVPQGGPDPTSPNHGKFKTQATEGKRGEADRGQGFGGGPGSFMAESGSKEDRALCDEAERWQGWGTALKPAHEPIILARKPLRVGGRKATVADNVLAHGTGALNIDATRIGTNDRFGGGANASKTDTTTVDFVEGYERGDGWVPGDPAGRWPANVILDPEAGVVLDEQTGTLTSGKPAGGDGPHLAKASVGVGGGAALEGSADGSLRSEGDEYHPYGDSGGASRFFYCAKTAKSERNAGLPVGLRNDHPTVKPVKLMEWLVKLVTPKGGTVLDPYLGSGSTLVAAAGLNLNGIGFDRDDEDKYLAIARHRIAHAESNRDDFLFAAFTPKETP